MTREDAIHFANCLKNNYTVDLNDMEAFCDMAIKALEQEPQTFKWCTDCQEYDQEKHCCHRWSKVIRDTVEEMKQEPRWIPVSERLPKAEYGESDSVLVCFENETQDVLYFDGSNWCYPTGETYIPVNHKNDWHNKVTAWMPLPKPYKAESEADNGNDD